MFFLYEYRKSDDSQSRVQLLQFDTNKNPTNGQDNLITYTFMTRSTAGDLLRLTAGVLKQYDYSTAAVFATRSVKITTSPYSK